MVISPADIGGVLLSVALFARRWLVAVRHEVEELARSISYSCCRNLTFCVSSYVRDRQLETFERGFALLGRAWHDFLHWCKRANPGCKGLHFLQRDLPSEISKIDDYFADDLHADALAAWDFASTGAGA